MTAERLEVLRQVDLIILEEIRNAGLYDAIWQAFTVLLLVRTVRVMADVRTYENVCGQSAVTSWSTTSPRSPPHYQVGMSRVHSVDAARSECNVCNSHMRRQKIAAMPRSVSLSFRVAEKTAAQLDELAAAMDRPRSWLLERALEEYLDVQQWQIAQIRKGMQELREGKGIPHEEVVAWLESWGTDEEREPPR